jgi:propionyl-CoA carboxylase beta chain
VPDHEQVLTAVAGAPVVDARRLVGAVCDEGSFLEIGALVEPARDTAFTEDLEAPGDGIVAGSATIDGRPIGLAAYDFTILGGSNGKIGGEKQARVTQLALDHGHPLVLLLEGGGHRIQEGLDARHFAAAGNTVTGIGTFEAMAHLSGWAPACAAIMGPGFAGPTNFAGLCDFVVMVEPTATMGMAGPALVRAATGQSLTNQELGGAAVQAHQYGLADVAAASDEDALAAIQRFLSFLPSNARAPLPIVEPGPDDAPDRRDDALMDVVPTNQRKGYDVRRVIELVADRGSTFELKAKYAANLVTVLARLGGRPVGFLANNPGHLAGMLDAKACDKGAHFIALCDAFGLPIVSLVDMPGFLIGPGAERTGLGRRSAKLLWELGHATVPRAAVVLRKGYGLGYFAMGGGRSFGAELAVAWPGAEICAMSVEGAVDVAYRADYEAAADPSARRTELIDTFKTQLGAVRGAEHFGIDDVIDPRDTRRLLIGTFERCAPRRHRALPPKYRSIAPI